MWEYSETQRIYYDKTRKYYKAITFRPYSTVTRCFKTFEEAVEYFNQKTFPTLRNLETNL